MGNRCRRLIDPGFESLKLESNFETLPPNRGMPPNRGSIKMNNKLKKKPFDPSKLNVGDDILVNRWICNGEYPNVTEEHMNSVR